MYAKRQERKAAELSSLNAGRTGGGELVILWTMGRLGVRQLVAGRRTIDLTVLGVRHRQLALVGLAQFLGGNLQNSGMDNVGGRRPLTRVCSVCLHGRRLAAVASPRPWTRVREGRKDALNMKKN